MEPTRLFSEIAAYGEAHTNPANIAKYTRYFREGFDAYGLGPEEVSAWVDRILATPGLTREKVHEITLMMVASPKYEMTVIAIRLLKHFHKTWTLADFRVLEQWFSTGITNWAETDYICGELMNLFFKKGLITIKTIESWRTAPNKFMRRAAVVGMIKPMKIHPGGFSDYYRFIAPMMHDPAREVHQGLGWFIRETWKKQPLPAEEFLMKYRETAPRLIFQYATEKMTREGKERFRRTRR